MTDPTPIVVQGEEQPDGTVEFPPPPLEPRDIGFEARKLSSEAVVFEDRDSDEYEAEAARLDLLNNLATQIGQMYPEVIRMAEVADLIAAVRSKNRYQLDQHQLETLVAAERILVRISGAYTVPDLFNRVLVCKEQK